MKIALIKNNKCVNIVEVASLEDGKKLYEAEFEVINNEIPIAQKYEHQVIHIGSERDNKGIWTDPTYVEWSGPPEA